MASSHHRHVPFQVRLRTDHPHLLEGLNAWIDLGLISETQVLRFCAQYLSCECPVRVVSDPLNEQSLQPISGLTEPEESRSVPPRLLPAPLQALQDFSESLRAEISVVWLLFLGVFLVVVSSGILAASQWQNVSSLGQYSILLAYTLAFWGVSEWTQRRERLQLTVSMLQLTTLLIIPVNFWMMDGLNLWRSLPGQGLSAISGVILSWITFRLLTAQPVQRLGSLGVGAIALSFLHLGWQFPNWPILAIYLGTCGTAFLICQRVSTESTEESPSVTPLTHWRSQLLSRTTLFYGALLLLFRGWLVQQVEISQLGLAFGLCGWIATWLARRRPSPTFWIGLGLLLFGWGLAFPTRPNWQAMAISGLALWILWDQLRQRWQSWVLFSLLAVGLQLLVWVILALPSAFVNAILAVVQPWAGTTALPEALSAIACFPYLWGMLGFARQLQRWNQPRLATQTHWSTLVIGGCLLLLTLPNELLRSLYLGLACLTLVSLRKSRLIGLAQFTGISAILSAIHFAVPNLSLEGWSRTLLTGMGLEWLVSWLSPSRSWSKSAWYSGVVLSVLGGVLYWFVEEYGAATMPWFILLIPAFLVFLSSRPQFIVQEQAYLLSLISIVLVQGQLFSTFPLRLMGFGTGVGLMAIQTARKQRLLPALLTVGFTIGLSLTATWHWVTGDRWDLGVNFLAIALLILALLRQGIVRQIIPGSPVYARAIDLWLGAIAGLSGIFLSIYCFFLWIKASILLMGLRPSFRVAAGITTAALFYRWWQRPHPGFLWLGCGGLDLWVVLSLGIYHRHPESLAIAQLGLAVIAQLLGDGWVRRTGQPYQWSWHGIPLVYAGLGLLVGHTQFTASTGLFTIATALITLFMGRRTSHSQPLTYVGLVGLSIGAYERLVYSLSQTQGGALGDAIILLAGLGALLAWVYQLLGDRLTSFLHLPPLAAQLTGQLHWMLGSLFMLAVITQPASPMGEWGGIAVLFLLGTHALWNGKRQSAWIYAGSLQCFVALTDCLQHWMPDLAFNQWGGAIVSLLAIAFYRLPWARWGWETLPWTRMVCLWPGMVILFTAFEITIQSLLMAGAAYAAIALQSRVFRISYISVALGLWAGWRLLYQYNVHEPLWHVMLLGAGLLYGAQFDPQLRSPEARQSRHLLRSLATGLISLTALYQSDAQFWLGIFTMGIGLLFILAGLMLKVRAFLYIGTLTILLKMLRLTWLFVLREPQALWAVGIGVGLLLTFIAANFEARRTQVSQMTQFWSNELLNWE
jgi:hypothetical protein